jgi:glutathione synthase/RimK-type ligase-like ATP-grasp enzyme
MTVGVIIGFDWRNPHQPLRSRRSLPFLRMVARARALRIYAVDWRSLADSGEAYAVSIRSGHVRVVSLRELDLLHVRSLGPRIPHDETLQHKWTLFLSRVAVIEALGVRCTNPPQTLRLGVDKSYLLALERAGVPVVNTRLVPASTGIDEIRERFSPNGDFVVKPSNGECGRWVTRLADLTELDLIQMRRQCTHLAIQSFVPEIRDGERSLYFMARELSHAVIKHPCHGDFRANGPHLGATVQPYRPSRAELDVAHRAIDAFGAPIDTCRVDLVHPPGGPVVMELEAIDPSPYIELDEALAERVSRFYCDIGQRA